MRWEQHCLSRSPLRLGQTTVIFSRARNTSLRGKTGDARPTMAHELPALVLPSSPEHGLARSRWRPVRSPAEWLRQACRAPRRSHGGGGPRLLPSLAPVQAGGETPQNLGGWVLRGLMERVGTKSLCLVAGNREAPRHHVGAGMAVAALGGGAHDGLAEGAPRPGAEPGPPHRNEHRQDPRDSDPSHGPPSAKRGRPQARPGYDPQGALVPRLLSSAGTIRTER
jgi:hypothetical protein